METLEHKLTPDRSLGRPTHNSTYLVGQVVVDGKYLEESRIAKGLSRYRVAVLLRVQNQTVGSWEKGEKNPTLGHLLSMCRLYDIPFDEDLLSITSPETTEDGPE